MAGYAASDPAAQLEGAFSDKILSRLARKVGDEWQDIGVELDFTMADIQQIRADVPQQEKHLVAVTFAIFRKWRSRNEHLSDEEKYNMLRRAFQEIEKQSLVYQLDQLVDISSIKEAGNKQVRLERENETLRQELEALKAQPGLQSHQQNDNNKNELVPSMSLHTLLSSTHTCVKEVEMSAWPWSLKLVRGELWSCQRDGITICDLRLDTKRHRDCAGMGTIHGVTELEECVVIAANDGLFTTSFDGENKKNVESGWFTGVCYANGCVYAARHDDSHIHVYNPSDWKRTHIIKTGCERSHCHTLIATSKRIALSCEENNCIYNIDVTGGGISKQGRRGDDAGQFRGPRVCQGDSNNALLVADYGNARFQLLNENQWHVLKLQPQPGKPRGAVYAHGALYVTAEPRGGPYKLRKYEPTS